MMWKLDEQVEAARKHPGWAEFHRQCGRHTLYFDHVERDGKRGPYKAVAFTVEKRAGHFVSLHVADGSGKTPIEAVADAYRRAGQPVAEAELAKLLGLNPDTDAIDMEDILG